MNTVITARDGWLIIRVGQLELVVPAGLDAGQDERVEVRCNGSRLWVESHDDGPLVSAIEKYS
jgi:hypothetical protein